MQVTVMAGIYFRTHDEAMLMLEVLEKELRERHGTRDEPILTKWFNELTGIRDKAKSESWNGWTT